MTASLELIPPPTVRRTVSVVIPARNEARTIGKLVTMVRAQQPADVELEVIVVDDGSSDETAAVARAAGARVLELAAGNSGGNPAVGRNRGAAIAIGDPIIFLDADCTPGAGWLARLLAAHDRGAVVVGGSLDLPPGLGVSARCDYYCGWYHAHSRRPGGPVPNHPPGNLSVRRDAFARTSGFTERQPVAYAHEELAWQADVRRAGGSIVFEPAAIVDHWNRPGFRNLLRRNYRWGYSAIESKAETKAARFSWVYRYPLLLFAGSIPLALGSAVYIVWCWARVGVLEPLFMFPAVLAARLSYSLGLVTGGWRWMRHGTTLDVRPRWE